MEVFINPVTLERVFINSPYVNISEQKYNVILYDPNGYNLDTGLYTRDQPSCQRWIDHVYQYQKQHPIPPLYTVDQDGNSHFQERRRGPRGPINKFVR